MSTQPLIQDPNLQSIWHDHHINKMNKTQLAEKYGMTRWAIDRRLKKADTSPSDLRPVQAINGPYASPTPIGTFYSPVSSPYVPAYNTPIARSLGFTQKQPGTPTIPQTVEEALEVWNDYIGYSAGPVIVAPDQAQGIYKKIVIINDIHTPFEVKEALKALIEEEAADTDLLIIGGDLLDLFAVSRYDKFQQHFSLPQEFRAGKAVLLELARHFRRIKIIPGNHDERWKKWLVQKRGMGPSEIEAMNLLAQMATSDDSFDLSDPLYCLTRDIPNVELVQPVVKDYAQFGFFVQEGDMIVSHAEKFSRLTGQTAAAASQWFKSCGIPSGICQDFRLFVQTHNHQASWAWGNFGVWQIEAGCLCKTPDYAANPKLMGAQRPSVVGWTVVYQDQEGRSDMRRSRFIPFEG